MRSLLWATLAALALACGPDATPPPKAKKSSKKAKTPKYDWADQPLTDVPGGRSWTKAGQWYSDNPHKLRAHIEGLLADTGATVQGRGLFAITPHAGIKHSGPTAAEVWARIDVPDLVILLAPDHSRTGPRLAIWDAGPWHMPGAAFAIDADATARARQLLPQLRPSRVAFRDHEAELNLPFLVVKNPQAKLVMMSFHDDDSLIFPRTPADEIQALGEGLAQLVRELEEGGQEVLVVATTDLVHYRPPAEVDEWDPQFLEKAAAWDVEGLRALVEDNRLTTCGEVPVSIAMVAMRELGRPPLEWTTRSHSGMNGKKKDKVVGYGGGALWK